MKKSIDEFFRAEYFDCHACLTGDCEHKTQEECLSAAFQAGYNSRDDAILSLEVEIDTYIRRVEKMQEQIRQLILRIK